MRYIIRYIVIVLFTIISSVSYAQLLNDADDYYNNLSYQKAIKKYKKIIKKEPENGDALFKLANSYRLNGETIPAEKWFAKAVNYTTIPNSRLFYAQVLLVNKKFSAAANWFNNYASITSNNYDIKNAKLMADYCNDIAENGIKEKDYVITKVSFNSDKLDFCPAFWGNDRLIFASNRKQGRKTDAWTSDNYVDLFYVVKDSAKNFSQITAFDKNINSVYHEGPSVFDSISGKLFLTRNDYIGNKRGYDEKENTRLQIYSVVLEDPKNNKLKKLPFNSNEYSCCHPAISADGTTLIFASDMPGGFGGMDLYSSYWDGKNWVNPENLGFKINTAGNELFPFLHSDGTLYFASNMHIGIGGLDIFVAESTEMDIWENPVNIGAPINSSHDDFGFIIGKDFSSGYFTSNRSGDDDIYHFSSSPEELMTTENYNRNYENSEYICGKVINKKYNTPLSNSNVKLLNKCSGEIDSVLTDRHGNFTFPLNMKCDYLVLAHKDNFYDNNHSFSTLDTTYTTNCLKVTIPLDLDEMIPLLSSNTKMKKGMIFELYNVYFDFDKYNIRNDASKDLDSLLILLRKYPEMTGEVSAHTDSRATHKYNETLSANRAKSAKQYLVNHGIDGNRLTTRGYGETQLKNECADGVECDELKHQMNRRVEFRVDYVGGILKSKEHVKYRTKPKTSNKKSL